MPGTPVSLLLLGLLLLGGRGNHFIVFNCFILLLDCLAKAVNFKIVKL